MICKKCHKEIGIDDLKCPFCGANNSFAMKHQQNMKSFDKRYKRTQKDVLKTARHISGLGKKAAILATLLIGMMVMIIITSLSYAELDLDDYSEGKTDAVRNAAEYTKKMDKYLEEGEYIEFAIFICEHYTSDSRMEEYKRFRCVQYLAKEYLNCIQSMERITLRTGDEDYHFDMDGEIHTFCSHLEGFYEMYENMTEQERNEKYMAYLNDMEKELRTATNVYFHIGDDEIDSFLNLSEAQKGVKLEEVLKDEE